MAGIVVVVVVGAVVVVVVSGGAEVVLCVEAVATVEVDVDVDSVAPFADPATDDEHPANITCATSVDTMIANVAQFIRLVGTTEPDW